MDISPISYDEWIKLNPDAEEQEEDCEECDGDGIIVCFNCGNDMGCTECGGTGKKRSSRKIYQSQKLRDLELLGKYNKYIADIMTPLPQ